MGDDRTILPGGVRFNTIGNVSGVTVSKRLLLIDDDAALRDVLSSQLTQQGEFRVVAVATAEEGRTLALAEAFDLILLDVGLPDGDGRAVCQQLREQGVKVPIILLTAAETSGETCGGPTAAASEAIAKPFRLNRLVARIRALIRQHEQSDDAEVCIGPYTFRPGARLIIDTKTQKVVRLTEKENAILTFLYRSGNRVISRDVLLDAVWGYTAGVTTHTLETHVYRLRQKLERNPAHARILVTENGGYRLATS
jgi:DNA-binding response OmpR family regulator